MATSVLYYLIASERAQIGGARCSDRSRAAAGERGRRGGEEKRRTGANAVAGCGLAGGIGMHNSATNLYRAADCSSVEHSAYSTQSRVDTSIERGARAKGAQAQTDSIHGGRLWQWQRQRHEA